MKTDRTTNPAIADLAVLHGEWMIELSNTKFLPSPESRAQGRVVAEWLDNTALVMRQIGDGDAATWIIGRDQAESEYTVLYSDSRGSSRVYRMTLTDGDWQIWRTTTQSTQRFRGRVSGDGTGIIGEWEDSEDGTTWARDFTLEYRRVEAGR
ncbi:hypothetical protein [Nocardia africana]|uniref:DUF1579 domain-containing protein n=1 Tax=Nocardia africana TaxID=134964 RepID=A0A378WSJ4_9NOCA|nr:hypothetical protein [Nocardia africana]MCC3314341.1 hypothetical protein [Nocardia africana]SUA43394.1 Uncharacterised protein [Nocardia africana]